MPVYEFLKRVPLFSGLPPEDLDRLCQMVEEVTLPAGQLLFSEGDMGEWAYVIEDGQVEILKISGGRQVLLAVRGAGEVIGEMSLLESAPRMATIRARTDCRFIAISQEQLDRLMNTSPAVARSMLHTFVARLRSNEAMLGQNEKMAQLGTLSAGMAHELNNPAAAALRGAEQLSLAIQGLHSAQLELLSASLDATQIAFLANLNQSAQQNALHPVILDPLDRSDREYAVETWLDDHGIENAWEMAPNLVQAGLNEQDLQGILNVLSASKVVSALKWLNASYSITNLLLEISMGTRQISEIVKAMKTYVYLDQAPVQEVDIHEGLENTLVILRSKIKKGVTVHRDYADDLPRVTAFGSELNQVWTNILDNAIDAMDGKGEITIHTRRRGDFVVVQLEDNGPGIPDDIQEKIFSPFFTTKPVGKGTGLGLNITWNIIQKHLGDIKVNSRPGKTVFEVYLPINFEKAQDGMIPLGLYAQPDDDTLRQILENTRTIAVVGITDKAELPSYAVPAYLQRQGYRIIPVNPYLQEVLGEKSYTDLSSIPEPVDTVLLFRRSEVVPPIVDEAIKVGAKVVWMQEGIINEEAASVALDAGLQVVMNTCMRVQHKRLIANK